MRLFHLLPLLSLVSAIPRNDHENYSYFAIQVDSSNLPPQTTLAEHAETVSREMGYHFLGNVGELDDYFLVAASKDDIPHRHVKRLSSVDSGIVWVEQQVPRKRLFKRDNPTRIRRITPRKTGYDDFEGLGIKDPGFNKQWHLVSISSLEENYLQLSV